MVAKVEIGLGCEYCCKFLFLLSDVVKCHTYPVREFRVGVLGCLLHSRDISPSSIRSLTRRRLDQTLNSVCVCVNICFCVCVAGFYGVEETDIHLLLDWGHRQIHNFPPYQFLELVFK